MADIMVAPMLLPENHPVAVASGVFNAIMVTGNALGEAMFYGQGAGKLPTASAVVADVIECMVHMNSRPHDITWETVSRENVIEHDECPVQVLVRLKADTDPGLIDELFAKYGYEQTPQIRSDEFACQIGLDRVNQLTEREWHRIVDVLGNQVISFIRFWQP